LKSRRRKKKKIEFSLFRRVGEYRVYRRNREAYRYRLEKKR